MEDKISYEEFRKQVLNINKPRTHKIMNCYGSYDAYKWIRKNKWLSIKRPLTEKQFYTIIRSINKYFANELANGKDVKLPCKMGLLEVRKRNVKSIMDEHGRIRLPVNWKKTLQLWYEDEEAYKEKLLLYIEDKVHYILKYNIYYAYYTNKMFYTWIFNRDIKYKLRDNIRNQEIDSFTNYG